MPALRWKMWLRRYFYFAMALATALIVVWGFSHTAGGNLFHPAIPRPRILWVHAALFSSWVLVYIAQTTLVRVHKVSVHRTMGWFGVGLAAAMLVIGYATAIVMGRFDVRVLHQAGQAVFEVVPFVDITSFGVFVTLAVLWRRKPELHRRLFFIATCTLLSAAFGRFPYIADHNLFYLGVDVMIALGLLRDWLVDGRVNKVYRVALPTLIAVHLWVLYMILHPPGWWVRTSSQWFG